LPGSPGTTGVRLIQINPERASRSIVAIEVSRPPPERRDAGITEGAVVTGNRMCAERGEQCQDNECACQAFTRKTQGQE